MRRVSPAFMLTLFLMPLYFRVVFPPCRDVRVSSVTLPLLHFMLTTNPPRAQMPFTLPSGHCSGRAGSSVIEEGVDCISISITPAQPPKLPSI